MGFGIVQVSLANNRGIIDWDLKSSWDYVDCMPAVPVAASLADTLNILMSDSEGARLQNKTLILQDAHFSLDTPETISAFIQRKVSIEAIMIVTFAFYRHL